MKTPTAEPLRAETLKGLKYFRLVGPLLSWIRGRCELRGVPLLERWVTLHSVPLQPLNQLRLLP